MSTIVTLVRSRIETGWYVWIYDARKAKCCLKTAKSATLSLCMTIHATMYRALYSRYLRCNALGLAYWLFSVYELDEEMLLSALFFVLFLLSRFSLSSAFRVVRTCVCHSFRKVLLQLICFFDAVAATTSGTRKAWVWNWTVSELECHSV